MVKGFLDDYAYTAAAYLSLYEATADGEYLQRAGVIAGEAGKQFADENGGYFLYGTKNDGLIARPKETYDGALPSGNSVMAYVLVRLLQYGQTAYETAVRKQFALRNFRLAARHHTFLSALRSIRHSSSHTENSRRFQRKERVSSGGAESGAVFKRIPYAGRCFVCGLFNRFGMFFPSKLPCFVI